MLSKQERKFLMFSKEFKKRYNENYCKKIRNNIRKKVVQTMLDIYYIYQYDKKWNWWKEGSKKKKISSFFLIAMYNLENASRTGSKNDEEKWIKDFLQMFKVSWFENKYKGLIIDKKTLTKIEK